MNIREPHPSWPNEIDFHCPHCDKPLGDFSEDMMYDDEQLHQCTGCGNHFTVIRSVTVSYNVRKELNNNP